MIANVGADRRLRSDGSQKKKFLASLKRGNLGAGFAKDFRRALKRCRAEAESVYFAEKYFMTIAQKEKIPGESGI